MGELKEFIYSILRYWRILILVALVAAIIGGGSYYYTHVQNIPLNVVERSEWDSQTDVYVSHIKFVGVGNETVSGENVRDAYMAKFYSNSFVSDLRDKYFENMSIKYVYQLLDIDSAGLKNFLGMDVLYYDENICKKLQNEILSYVEDINYEMSLGLGEHKLFLIDASIEEKCIDDVVDKVTDIKEASEKDLNETEIEVFSMKKLFVYSVLSIFLGEFFICMFLIIKDAITDNIYNTRFSGQEKALEVLGDFSALRINGKIDRIIYDMLIGKIYFTESGIAKIVNHKLNNMYGEDSNFVLIGNLSKNELQKKADLLNSENVVDKKYVCRELLNKDADGIQMMNIEKKIIYVVRRFEKGKKEVLKNIELYRNLGFEIAGILFI